MKRERTMGRGIGVLVILQLAAGLVLSFVLMDAVRAGYPSFLENAAPNAGVVRTGVVVATLGAALTVCLGLAMFTYIAQYSRKLAMAFAAVCLISAALDMVHNGTILSMLSASEQFTAAGGATGPNAALYDAWGIAAASARRSAHLMQLVLIGVWISTFYIALLRCRLIPRPLAVLGLFGIASQFIGVTVMMFLGNSPITYLAMPLAPIHLLAAGWIIAKGLNQPQLPPDAA